MAADSGTDKPEQLAALSSAITHELRNPLSSVKMAVQAVGRGGGISIRDRRRLTIAAREIRNIERMLALFAEYGKELSLHLEPKSLRSLVDEAAASIREDLAERGIELSCEEEAQLPGVHVDAQRVKLVLSQLLLNAALGCPEGSTLRVSLCRRGGAATITLKDPEGTLTDEGQLVLFRPFASRLARTAGLSLAVLHRVIKAHGGSVRAEGSPEPGVTWTVSFPLA